MKNEDSPRTKCRACSPLSAKTEGTNASKTTTAAPANPVSTDSRLSINPTSRVSPPATPTGSPKTSEFFLLSIYSASRQPWTATRLLLSLPSPSRSCSTLRSPISRPSQSLLPSRPRSPRAWLISAKLSDKKATWWVAQMAHFRRRYLPRLLHSEPGSPNNDFSTRRTEHPAV